MSPHHRAVVSRLLCAALLLPLMLGGAALPVRANTLFWNNAVGGSAAVGTNWQPIAVPTSFDDLIYLIVAGAYTVDFPPAVPQSRSQSFHTGSVTLTTGAPHSIAFDLRVVETGSLTLSGASLRAAWLEVDRTSNAGRLRITSSGGFPSVASRLKLTDSTSASSFARNSGARVEILGGSQLILDGRLDMAIAAAARCTLEVAGQEGVSGIGSRLQTTNPRLGQFFWPADGQVICNISNGGVLQLAGETRLSAQGIGSIQVGVRGSIFGGYATFDGPLYVGGNPFPGNPGGTATIFADAGGVITANGPLTIGDPDGGGGSGVTVLQGGVLFANQGITVRGNGSLNLPGGFTKVIGGAFRPNSNSGLALGLGGGTVNTPIFWIANHVANDYVSHFNGILIGGLGGGTLHVTGAGTTFGTTNNVPCSVNAIAGAQGALVVDTSATFEAGGAFEIGGPSLGTVGATSLTLTSGGVVHAPNTTVGGTTSGSALATVKGAGSLLRYGNTLYVGGPATGATGPSTVTADSGGAISGVTGAGATLVVVQAPVGRLVSAHGGTVSADSLRLLGLADLDRGTLAMTLVNISASGTLGGRGSVTGSVTNAGLVRGLTNPLLRTALTVGGAYTQASGGELRLLLGREGGRPQNDTLVVAGSATLNGVLALQPDPSFVQSVGDTFTVVRYGARTGTFTSVTWLGNPASAIFDLVYLPDRLIAVVKLSALDVGDAGPRALRLAVRDNAARPQLVLDLPKAAFVRLELFDVNGRRAVLVHEGSLSSGRFQFSLEPARHELSPGVYLARAIAGEQVTRAVRVILTR